MSKGIVMLLVLVFLTASCLTVAKPAFSSAATTENTWETMAPMPTARSQLGVDVVNGKIYAIGGDYNVNEMYDPETNTWSTKTPMPTPSRNFGIAVYGSKIYCIGGGSWDNMLALNQVYDTATDTWTTKTSMPTARNYLSANVVNGKIYMIGGNYQSYLYTSNLNEVYDIATDTWSTAKPLPQAVANYPSAVIDGRIYIVGGTTFTKSFYTLQIYDPATDSWNTGASIPHLDIDGHFLGGAVGAATTGQYAPRKLYVFGGQNIFSANGVSAYDSENGSWCVCASMPTARGYLGVAVVDDVLYAIGGTGWNYEEPPVSVNEKYTPIGYGTVPPAVYVVSPEENMTYPAGDVSLTFTVNRPVVELSYSLDGGANVSITGNTTLTGLTVGVHNVTVYAADQVGNVGASETATFTITEPESFPTVPVAAVSTASAIVVSAGLIVYFKKHRH
jgi:N-acetylneuraminic acid mutarotase